MDVYLRSIMRKIINSTYISLDGVIENPQNWQSLGSFDEDGFALQMELLSACDAVLMGRHTYDGFAPAWSTRSGDPYSDRINSMAKYVVSSTLRDPEWTNTTVIDGDVLAEIEVLKKEPGQDIVQFGFGQLSFALMEHGLLDELRLWVHPFFVGTGGSEDLLFRNCPPASFKVASATTLKSGVVILTYQAA
jgi:dihydrofolate reductase